MKIINEIITKFQYLETVDAMLLTTYIIKCVLNETITKELIDDAKPDNDIIYVLYIRVTEEEKEKEFMVCNFMFMDSLYGFISYDGKIVYTMNDHILQKYGDSGIESYELVTWYKENSEKHKYINFNGLFFLS